MNRDDLIESMANSEAAFDGRTFLGLSSVEKMRYRGRCAANLASIEAQGLAIVPVEATEAMENSAEDLGANGPLSVDCWEAMMRVGRL